MRYVNGAQVFRPNEEELMGHVEPTFIQIPYMDHILLERD